MRSFIKSTFTVGALGLAAAACAASSTEDVSADQGALSENGWLHAYTFVVSAPIDDGPTLDGNFRVGQAGEGVVRPGEAPVAAATADIPLDPFEGTDVQKLTNQAAGINAKYIRLTVNQGCQLKNPNLALHGSVGGPTSGQSGTKKWFELRPLKDGSVPETLQQGKSATFEIIGEEENMVSRLRFRGDNVTPGATCRVTVEYQPYEIDNQSSICAVVVREHPQTKDSDIQVRSYKPGEWQKAWQWVDSVPARGGYIKRGRPYAQACCEMAARADRCEGIQANATAVELYKSSNLDGDPPTPFNVKHRCDGQRLVMAGTCSPQTRPQIRDTANGVIVVQGYDYPNSYGWDYGTFSSEKTNTIVFPEPPPPPPNYYGYRPNGQGR